MLTNSDTGFKISDTQISIQIALAKYEYKEPSIEQLAEHMGFNTDERQMIKLFWEPAFNQGCIYLSDEIILGQMTNETGKDAIRHFYIRVLLSDDYIEEVDYKR
jgi:hypothetical protein